MPGGAPTAQPFLPTVGGLGPGKQPGPPFPCRFWDILAHFPSVTRLAYALLTRHNDSIQT